MTLAMLKQENYENGRKEGIEIGIIETVSSLRYFNVPDHDIFQKIQEEYNLSMEEAEHYMESKHVKTLIYKLIPTVP